MRCAKYVLTCLLFYTFTNHLVLASTWANKLAGSYYTSIENTSYGLLAGEFDERTFLQPYNGLLISKNLGNTWTGMGLSGRGITDIQQQDQNLYVTTYYQKDNMMGLFKSSDKGDSWEHIGPNVSATTIETANTSVLLGTYSHGLWVSFDNGNTFQQKIGTGFFGPKVLSIETNNNQIIAGTVGTTYLSSDAGHTWTAIPALNGKQIAHIAFAETKIYVGTFDIGGIFVSNDNTSTWNKLDAFGNTSVGGLIYINSVLYAGKYSANSNKTSIYKSSDDGATWENTGLDITSNTPVTKMVYFYSSPEYLIASVVDKGVYAFDLPVYSPAVNSFLRLPWDSQNSSELIDKINSFFDHRYPLLAYSPHPEPEENSTTTQNFLGIEDTTPGMYYSSHSGIDFLLPYGTPVLAAADGIASYAFCTGCGHTIKIDHLNGYQSIYEHLQQQGLVTTDSPVPVSAGQKIGKVGLTGYTSGPHLHFEITKDTNDNGNFNDDYPHGRTDPFGWLSSKLKDPWASYSWSDNTGTHQGTLSKYLWTDQIPQLKALLTPNSPRLVSHENKTFNLQNINDLMPFNLEYFAYSPPHLPGTPNNLKYVANTSFILNFVDTAQNNIKELPQKIYISMQLNEKDLVDILVNTLKLYYYSPTDGTWKPLFSYFDDQTDILTAETNHLSRFAVLGEAGDTTPPITTIDIRGDSINGWYVEAPSVTLTSNASDLDKMFYSLDNGTTWNEYINQITLGTNGITTFLYRSMDTHNNLEETQTATIKINLDRLPTKTVIIKEGTFTMVEN